jgi:hypothetical protein
MLRSLFLVLALSAGAYSLTAEAKQLPPGSWGGSCSGATVVGNTLTAQCRSTSGDKRWTSIDYTRCPGNAVANDEGYLVCDTSYNGGGNNNGWMPGGSWQQTCRNSSVQGNMLYASCQRMNGGWRDSSINYRQCRNFAVANDNGNLVCESNSNNGWMPGGSWQQTCRNSSVQGNTLYASCQKMNGGWRDSSINYRQCSNGAVANDNGNLVCENNYNNQLPGGSWQQTCRNAYVQGNTLYASCQRRDGGWRDAQFNYRQCGNNRVANDNGRLVCQ